MHQGVVQSFSAGLGKGSEFVVRLPLLSHATPDGGQESNSGQDLRSFQDFRTLKDLARERGDILSYTAGSILVKSG